MLEPDKRIYVVVAGTIQVPYQKTIVQPLGRQIAQACHAVSKLRINNRIWSNLKSKPIFNGITTIVLQCRDSAELMHNYWSLKREKLEPVMFLDENYAYGLGSFATAVAVYTTQAQVEGILDYLPLWGA
jgi:hypothetical protein